MQTLISQRSGILALQGGEDVKENPWDVKTYEIPADKEQEVTDLRDRITRVSDTREYPATFSIWSQLLLSIALPKALQLFLTGV